MELRDWMPKTARAELRTQAERSRRNQATRSDGNNAERQCSFKVNLVIAPRSGVLAGICGVNALPFKWHNRC